MWTDLLATLDAAADAAPTDLADVAALMLRLTSHTRRAAPRPDAPELPWGRYLVHLDPRGRYNLQLDVFSRGYTGQIHAHGTWGAFWVLQGALVVTDCELREGAMLELRVTQIGPGGCQCFHPPLSDWHRVATPDEGPQTISLHLYGPGYDLDTGLYHGERGPAAYRRGPLGDLDRLRPHLHDPRG